MIEPENITETIVTDVSKMLAEDAKWGRPWAQEYHTRLEGATTHEEKAAVIAELYNEHLVPALTEIAREFDNFAIIMGNTGEKVMDHFTKAVTDALKENGVTLVTLENEEETDAENTS